MLVVTEQDLHVLRRAGNTEFGAYLKSQAAQIALGALGLEGVPLHREQGKAQVLIELAEMLTKIRSM